MTTSLTALDLYLLERIDAIESTLEELKRLVRKRRRTGYTALPPHTHASYGDHGSLEGLLDDDHTQYLRHDGSRAMTGNLDMEGNKILFSNSQAWANALLKIYNAGAIPNTIAVRDELDSGYGSFYYMYAYNYGTRSVTQNYWMRTRAFLNDTIIFQTYQPSGSWTDVAYAKNDEFVIPCAGDITFLANKVLKVGNIDGTGTTSTQTKYFPVDDGGVTRYIAMYDSVT